MAPSTFHIYCNSLLAETPRTQPVSCSGHSLNKVAAPAFRSSDCLVWTMQLHIPSIPMHIKGVKMLDAPAMIMTTDDPIYNCGWAGSAAWSVCSSAAVDGHQDCQLGCISILTGPGKSNALKKCVMH